MADPVDEMATILSNVGDENEMRDDIKDKTMDDGNSDFDNESGVATLSKYDDASDCDSKMKNCLKVSVNELNVSRSQQNEGFNMIVENEAPDNTIDVQVIQEEDSNLRNDTTDTRVELEIDRMMTEIETTLKGRGGGEDNSSKIKGKRQGNLKFVGKRNRRKFCETAGRVEQGAKRIGEDNSSIEVKRYHLRNKMAVKRSKYQSTIKGYQAYVSGLENTKVKNEDLSFEETVGESPQDVMIITEDLSVDDMGNIHVENNESSSDDDMDEWICQSDEEDDNDDDHHDDDDDGDSFQDIMVRILYGTIYIYCFYSWLILEHKENGYFCYKSNKVN